MFSVFLEIFPYLEEEYEHVIGCSKMEPCRMGEVLNVST